jgi:predicted transcriptional regulator of viral defense system
LKTSTTQKYAARAGSAEEAWRVGYLSDNNIINVNATNLVRGVFGAYIGLEPSDNSYIGT